MKRTALFFILILVISVLVITIYNKVYKEKTSTNKQSQVTQSEKISDEIIRKNLETLKFTIAAYKSVDKKYPDCTKINKSPFTAVEIENNKCEISFLYGEAMNLVKKGNYSYTEDCAQVSFELDSKPGTYMLVDVNQQVIFEAKAFASCE